MYLNNTILYLIVAFISHAVCPPTLDSAGMITTTKCRPEPEHLVRHNWQLGNYICIGVFLSSLVVFVGGLAVSVRLGGSRTTRVITLVSSAILAIVGIAGMSWPAGPGIEYDNPNYRGQDCTSYHWG